MEAGKVIVNVRVYPSIKKDLERYSRLNKCCLSDLLRFSIMEVLDIGRAHV